MLILSRKKGEKVMIGDDVVIEIHEIRKDKVRLAIFAPKDMPIHRAELLEFDIGGENGNE